MSAWGDHVAKWKDCDKCPLCRQRFRICLARGDVPCDVLFVGEAPGASEDATGLPFQGPAGDLLQQVVDQALGPLAACSTCGALRFKGAEEPSDWTCKNGHLRRDGHGGRIVYYAMTNLVCCYPREAKQRGDNEPERAEIDACRPRLVEFVNIARPRLIVCVGRLATDRVDHLDTVRCADIVHPAHVLRKDVPQAQKQSIMHRAVVVLRNAVAAALDSVGTDFQEWGTRRAKLKTGRERIQAAYDDADIPF